MVTPKILYIGQLIPDSTTVQRMKALERIGGHLECITTVLEDREALINPRLTQRVYRKLFGTRDHVGANAKICELIQKQRFDIAWIDKGLTITPRSLRLIKERQPDCQIVGFSPDDMLNPANQSKHFLSGLNYYDYYVTTKSYNVLELNQLGCLKVLFMDNGYDSGTHRPLKITENEKAQLGGKVGFIGQWEKARSDALYFLANSHVKIRVWGYSWECCDHVPKNLHLENRPLWGDQYAKALCAFDVNLCFLRKCNRDLQTTRSVEIPACSAFMLAERTDEHLKLFDEGKEAEFFDGNQELLEKIVYYLNHKDKRFEIANAGYLRCLRDGYSYDERLKRVLVTISQDNHSSRLSPVGKDFA